MLFSSLADCCCFSTLLLRAASSPAANLSPMVLHWTSCLLLHGRDSAALSFLTVHLLLHHGRCSSPHQRRQHPTEIKSHSSQYIWRGSICMRAGARGAALHGAHRRSPIQPLWLILTAIRISVRNRPHPQIGHHCVHSSTYMKYIQFLFILNVERMRTIESKK